MDRANFFKQTDGQYDGPWARRNFFSTPDFTDFSYIYVLPSLSLALRSKQASPASRCARYQEIREIFVMKIHVSCIPIHHYIKRLLSFYRFWTLQKIQASTAALTSIFLYTWRLFMCFIHGPTECIFVLFYSWYDMNVFVTGVILPEQFFEILW